MNEFKKGNDREDNSVTEVTIGEEGVDDKSQLIWSIRKRRPGLRYQILLIENFLETTGTRTDGKSLRQTFRVWIYPGTTHTHTFTDVYVST